MRIWLTVSGKSVRCLLAAPNCDRPINILLFANKVSGSTESGGTTNSAYTSQSAATVIENPSAPLDGENDMLLFEKLQEHALAP